MSFPEPSHPHRSNDIWISASMIGVLISIVIGVITVNKTLTDQAVLQEKRFVLLEESVKNLKDGLQEYKNRFCPTPLVPKGLPIEKL